MSRSLGPMRKIVGYVYPDIPPGAFDRDLVKLECGHEVWAYGASKTHCYKKLEGSKPNAI